MNQTIQKLGLGALVCLLAVGCHSSSSTTPAPATTAQTAAAPQPAPAVVAAAPAASKKLVCTGFSKDAADGADFIEESDFFVLMQSKLGGWVSCKNKNISKTDEVTTVTFPHGGILTISQYPSSDASTGEAVLDAGSGVTPDDAIKVLKGGGPPDFCGVDWSKLKSSDPNATGDLKTSGTTCSLDVHIKMLKGSVVGFGYGMAS